jgi:hypothetical protein
LQKLNAKLGLAARFAGYDQLTVLLDSGHSPRFATVTRYCGDLLGLLSAEYLLDGRAAAGGNRVFVGESYWRKSLGANPDVVGRVQELNGEEYRIAGVVRANPAMVGESDFWVPVCSRSVYGGMTALRVVGALRPGEDCRRIEKSITRLVRREAAEGFLEAESVRLLPIERKLVLYPASPERLAGFNLRRKPAV